MFYNFKTVLLSVLLSCTLLLLFVSQAKAIDRTSAFGFSDIVITAELTSSQVEFLDDDDAPGIADDDDDDDTTSKNLGAAVCFLQRNLNPNILNCEISHTSSIATSIEIRKGFRNTNGRLVTNVAAAAAGGLPFHVQKVYQMPIADNEVQERQLLNGEWYILLRANGHPAGELRGQLERRHDFYSVLTPAQVVPAIDFTKNPTTNRGALVANYSLHSPRAVANFLVVHTVFNLPNDARTRLGAVGRTSNIVIHSFNSSSSPIVERDPYTDNQEVDLFAQRHYIQIESFSHPNGELRGQLKPNDPIPPVTHMGRLDRNQVVPPVQATLSSDERGCVIVSYQCSTREIEYLIVHNVAGATSAAMLNGKERTSGTFVFNLSRGKSPIYGKTTLTNNEEKDFLEGKFYVEVRIGATARIRAQVTKQFDYFAYLTGRQVVPPVSTFATGCATFDLRPNRFVDYDIIHTAPQTAQIVMQHDDIGKNARFDNIKATFTSDKSGLVASGSDILLHPTHRDYFRQEEMYVNVRTARFPNGELRGQILRRLKLVCDRTKTPDEIVILPPEIPSEFLFGVQPPSPVSPVKQIATASSILPPTLFIYLLVLFAFFIINY